MRSKSIFAGVMLITLLVAFLVYDWKVKETSSSNSIAKTVLKYTERDGIFRDRLGELGINSPEDVSFKRKGSTIHLYYGDLLFTIDESDLKTEALRSNLKAIGIEMGFNKAGTFIIKYKGEVIKQYE